MAKFTISGIKKEDLANFLPELPASYQREGRPVVRMRPLLPYRLLRFAKRGGPASSGDHTGVTLFHEHSRRGIICRPTTDQNGANACVQETMHQSQYFIPWRDCSR